MFASHSAVELLMQNADINFSRKNHKITIAQLYNYGFESKTVKQHFEYGTIHS